MTREVYTENDVKGKHMRSLNFTIEKLFKCSICHKIFQNDNYRKKHVHKKHKDVIVNKSACIHCGKDCGTNSNRMRKHVEKCQKGKSIKEVGEQLSNKVKMDTSTDNNMYKAKFTCEYCKKQFHNVVNYTKHLDVCKISVECRICGKIFSAMKQYHNHKRSCTQKNFTCIICKKQMSHSDTLATHMKQHYPVMNTLTCPKCKKNCLTEKELQLHITENHINL